MNVLLIIRTCVKDDFLAYHCYQSFKEKMDVSVVFFAEHGNYKWIHKTAGQIVYHATSGNYGGTMGVQACMNYLPMVSTVGFDKIIFADSDITLLKDPTKVSCCFGGVQDANNSRHFSGQCLIYEKWLWDKVIFYNDVPDVLRIFLKEGWHIADDIVMSYIATEFTNNTYNFKDEYWKHEKLYHLEPNE